MREPQSADPLVQLSIEIDNARSDGSAWRLALEAIGRHAPAIWRLFPEYEKATFAKSDWLRLYYVKRHAMQMGTALWLQKMIKSKRIVVGLPPPGAFDRLVVATGPEYRSSQTTNPLIRAVIDSGIGRPCFAADGTELGGLKTANLQLVGARGIWAMGALVRGEEFAVHSYPALARHARIIVGQLK
jgi:hypothetical protein